MLDDLVLSSELELRIAQAEDEIFMEQLFRSTREFLYSMPMPKQYVDVLIGQQYQLQQASYRQQAPSAVALIIQLQGKPVGKVMVNKDNTAFHIVDCVLTPHVRGNGYGTAVFRAIQLAAAKRSMLVKLSVDRQNLRAKKLYLSLGFHVNEISATHESMLWSQDAV